MADKYLLHVTAGPDYNPSTHQTVLVNTPTPTTIASPHATTTLSVRIQNYHGLPKDSPKSSPYFSRPSHTKDQYSIEFRLTPHSDISAQDLVFGNDFDKPVKDRLPPGFNTAFKIVKSWIDPGLEGDFYSDRPHLYGCALSSFNVLYVGDTPEQLDGEGKQAADESTAKNIDEEKDGGEEEEEEEEGQTLAEGGSTSGSAWRKERDVPTDAAARKKWALTPAHQEKWTWEKGREYRADFFNPYLDFNDFSLKLPGFSLSVLGFMGGEDYLRYVLKNKQTGDVLLIVTFALVKREDFEREEAEKGKEEGGGEEKGGDAEGGGEDQVDGGRHEGEKSFVPEASDVD